LRYYQQQFHLLLKNHGKHRLKLEVGTSSQPIPIHFSFAEHEHLEGSLTAERRLLMRDVFDLPDLAAMDDGIANGTHEPRAGEALPLSLFTAPRVDYSLQRLRHYTALRASISRSLYCSPITSSISTNSSSWATS
jgi:AMP nucleosidase